MAFKIFFVMLSVAAIQALPLQSCNQQAANLRMKINMAIQEAHQNFRLVRANTGISIDATLHSIQDRVDELKRKVNQVPGADVSHCRIGLSRDLVPLSNANIHLCWNNNNLAQVNMKIDDLNRFKGEASRCCTFNADQCIASGISDIASNLENLSSEISTDINNLENELSECVRNHDSIQTDVINTASSNLDACLPLVN